MPPPSVVGSATFTRASNATSSTLTYPTVTGGILANDFILVIHAIDANTSRITVPTATGWTILGAEQQASTADGVAYGKFARGGETGTFSVAHTSERDSAIILVIRGVEQYSTPQIAWATAYTTADPDPPSLTPPWGAQDTLWVAGFFNDASVVASAAPTNYTNLTTIAGDLSNASVSLAYRQLNAATENPGTFTAAAEEGVAFTIAFQPVQTDPSSYAAAILAETGLVGYWRLDDKWGLTATTDAGSSGGSMVNAPTLNAAALIQDGSAITTVAASTNDITFPHTPVTDTGSIEFWFKWTAGVCLMRDHTATAGWLIGYDNAGTFTVKVNGLATPLSTSKTTAQMQDGNRHHLVVVRQPTTPNVEVFVDGVSVGTQNTATTTASASPWHLGKNGQNAQYTDATYDELALYSVALTSTQVAAHYAAGTGSGSTQFQTITATATGTATLLEQMTLRRTLTATATGTATLVKGATKSLTATATGTPTLGTLKALFVTLAATGTGTATLNLQSTLRRTLTATATGTPTLVRSATKTLAATATGTSSLTKRASKTLAATGTGTASLALASVVRITLTATATGTASLVKTAMKLLSATSTGTATQNAAPKGPDAFQTISATATGTPSLSLVFIPKTTLIRYIRNVRAHLRPDSRGRGRF